MHVQVSDMQPATVWIVGGALATQVRHRALQYPEGTSLGLGRLGMEAVWKVDPGFSLDSLFPALIQELEEAAPKPSAILLHSGDQDIGTTRHHRIRRRLARGLKRLTKASPGTKLVWSDIPPRRRSGDVREDEKLERLRVRINGFGGNYISGTGGYRLHAAFTAEEPNVFQEHSAAELTPKGSDLILTLWRNELLQLLRQ